MGKVREAVLCFVLINDEVIMINRNKPPFMGMWNALGGKVEDGESPEDAAIREIEEESGIKVNSVERISRFTWNYDDEIGYAFISRIKDTKIKFPISLREGIIDVKSLSWVLNEKNYGVIEDLRVFINDIQNGEKHDYHLIYKNSKLVKCVNKDLDAH